MKAYCLILPFAPLLLPSAQAQRQTFEADPAKSQVQFTLEATLHAVHGTFHLEHGTLSFSRNSSEMSGLIAVDAHSGDSGEGSRDKKMTQDELKADKFTAITFAPKSYTGEIAAEGDSDIVVRGAFTLLGSPHDIAVPMHIHIAQSMCNAKGSFEVPFVQWGMKDPSSFVLKVNKQVTIALDLTGTLSPAATQK